MPETTTVHVVFAGVCRSCGAQLRYRGKVGALAPLPGTGRPFSVPCACCGKPGRLKLDELLTRTKAVHELPAAQAPPPEADDPF